MRSKAGHKIMYLDSLDIGSLGAIVSLLLRLQICSS
jgi:hypothetical protein